jgi:hypothetical protein
VTPLPLKKYHAEKEKSMDKHELHGWINTALLAVIFVLMVVSLVR